MKARRRPVPLLFSLIAFVCCFAPAQARIETITVHSPSLESNLLGDSADRAVHVYLPPGYGADSDQRYPVLCLLHGYTSNHNLWMGTGYLGGMNIDRMADGLIEAGTMRPFLIVMPSADNAYWGSWYTNSEVTGNWEDFVVEDLVSYIDANYATLAGVANRGLAGHSMGGYGAIYLAMRHPETYSSVYAMSAAAIDMATFILDKPASGFPAGPTAFMTIAGWDGFPGKNFTNWVAKANLALAVAIAPNPGATPFMADLPIVADGGEPKVVDTALQRWMAFDPLSMIATHGANLAGYRGVRIDCGTEDDLISQNRNFAAALKAAGIAHTFEEYSGDHTSRIVGRVQSLVLPFFSDELTFEAVTAVPAVSWGKVKASP